MDLAKVGSGLVLLALAVAAVVIAATTAGLTVNEQLLGSDWEAATVATGALFLAVLTTFAALGRPWEDWSHTPYW